MIDVLPKQSTRISYAEARDSIVTFVPPVAETFLQKITRISNSAKRPLTKAVLGALVATVGLFGNPTEPKQSVKNTSPNIENPADDPEVQPFFGEAVDQNRGDAVRGDQSASHGPTVSLDAISPRNPQGKEVSNNYPVQPDAVRTGQISEEANP